MAKNKEVIAEGKLNEVIITEKKRPNGTLRVQQDFTYCPTLAEQHTQHLTDLNYLIAKYKPDELAAYMAARFQHRQEILGVDFSIEPNLQEAKNFTYNVGKIYEQLPENVQNQFRNKLEFMKFLDNPKNQETLVKLGLAKAADVKEISQITTKDGTTTKEAEPIKE